MLFLLLKLVFISERAFYLSNISEGFFDLWSHIHCKKPLLIADLTFLSELLFSEVYFHSWSYFLWEFMFYLWSYFNARSNYLFLKLRLSPSYFHSLKLAVIRLSLKLLFISDVYFYLKSILMFEVTFNVWSYSHLWIYSFLELGFISGVFLLRSYFSSLKLLLFFGVSFYLWTCFLSLKQSGI